MSPFVNLLRCAAHSFDEINHKWIEYIQSLLPGFASLFSLIQTCLHKARTIMWQL